MDSIFKSYDIRGLYPEEINENLAFKLGAATAKFLKARKMVVAHDARPSSAPIAEWLIEGINRTGCNLVNIGQATTPLFYFSVQLHKADGGIVITASHNPPHYNGFKIIDKNSMSIGLESGLKDIEELLNEPVPHDQPKGEVSQASTVTDYVNFLLEVSGVDKIDAGKLQVAIDAGNGMVPIVFNDLLKKININATTLFFEIRSGLPERPSNVAEEKNLMALKKKVLEMAADFGVAFDGDGDRMAVIDNTGKLVRADIILALLFKNKILDHGDIQSKVVYDLRASRGVRKLFGPQGIRSRVGHVNIKQVMRENDAKIGGELSGHYFFKEMHYTESAILAMLYLIKIVQSEGKPLSELVKPFKNYHHSGDVNIEIPDITKESEIIKTLKEKYSDAGQDFLDGITIEYSDWWANVRLSHTEPIVRLVVEANSEELMDKKVFELETLIKEIAL